MKPKVVAIIIVVATMLLSSCGAVLDIVKKETSFKIDEKDIALYSAMFSNNLEATKDAVKAGADVTIYTGSIALKKTERSVVLYAFEIASDQILKYLLDNGSDPNYMDSDGRNLLMYTVGTPRNGARNFAYFDPKYTQLLIDYGADVDAEGFDGNTALDCAIKYGNNFDCQRVLMDNGAEVSQNTVNTLCGLIYVKESYSKQDDIGNFLYTLAPDILTRVLVAAEEKKLKIDINPIIKSLVFGEIDQARKQVSVVNITGRDIKPVTYFMSAFGTPDLFSSLESKGVIKVEIDDDNENLLSIAAAFGNLEMTKYFIKRGFRLSARKGNETPLDYAVMNNHYDIARYLLGEGAALSTVTADSTVNTLKYALRSDDGLKLTELVYGSQNKIDKDTMLDAICGAITYKNEVALEFLIEKAKQQGYSLETEALIDVCSASSHDERGLFSWDTELPKLVSILINSGADVNAMTKDDNLTPLGYAADGGLYQIVKLLVSSGADVNLAYDGGEHPLTCAVGGGFYDIVKYLVDNGAKIDNGDELADGDLLGLAKELGGKRIYEFLLENSHDET